MKGNDMHDMAGFRLFAKPKAAGRLPGGLARKRPRGGAHPAV